MSNQGTAGDPATRWVMREEQLLDQIEELEAENVLLREGSIDVAHIDRQRTWSENTFGPYPRLDGVVDHIRKELVEVVDSGNDLSEWVDVIMLALDGACGSGASSQEIIDAVKAKLKVNEARTWPDWHTADRSQAIEHVR